MVWSVVAILAATSPEMSCILAAAGRVCVVAVHRAVLGLILFLLYTVNLPAMIKQYGLMPHRYADNMQIYGFCQPGSTGELLMCGCHRIIDAE